MDGAERIAAERNRQIEEEGYSPDHDRSHTNGALSAAVAAYAAPYPIYHLTVAEGRDLDGVQHGTMNWHEPWPGGWERPARAITPADRIRELEKAGALIAAEIDRMLAVLDGA